MQNNKPSYQRFPFINKFCDHIRQYQVPVNLNGWYVFGAIALVVLLMQIVTGITLLFHYEATIDQAFLSVQRIMREINVGWLVRYIHTTGASAFFIVIYLHIFRSLLYGSYRRPRELVWLFGMGLYLCLMAEAFFGYLLPWGQMSYWGAKVITSLFGEVPVIGDTLVTWIRGGDSLAQATLSRFYVLHILLVPTAIIGLVLLHILSLHAVGGNHPDAGKVDDDSQIKRIPFYPYFTIRDSLAIVIFLLIFFAVVFYAPEMHGYFIEYHNSTPANAAVTPEHMAPMWYFSLFYAMLKWVTADMVPWFMGVLALFFIALIVRRQRAQQSIFAVSTIGGLVLLMMTQMDPKALGILCMVASIVIWFGLPWLDQAEMRSMRYRPTWHKYWLYAFVLNCFWLGYSGLHALEGDAVGLAKLSVIIYFIFFLGMPWWSRWGKSRENAHE